jgi:nucleotide-binding universal stress UspA family protein
MTTTVLVPLDGSDKDERALPAAAAFAELAGGDLHLIRVLDTPVGSLSPRAMTMGALDAVREIRRDMEQSVRGIADRLTTDTGRSVTAEVAEGFDVAGVLVDRATERPADLVVMATRAPGTLGRALRGSVADRVIRESPRPVVLVPPRAEDLGGKHLQFGRVLVPLDGSELALGVIDHLLGLKRARELEYILLEVVTSGVVPEWVADTPALQPYRGSPDFTQARVNAEQRLSRVADRLRAHGVKDVRVRVAEGPDPAAAIARAVRRESADFIAMSTRGRGGLKRFVLGSVTEKLLRESDVPVLLVTSRDR